MNDNLGATIRDLRVKKKQSLDALARETGLTSHHIGRVERGEMPNVTLRTLDKIAKALGVKARDLLPL